MQLIYWKELNNALNKIKELEKNNLTLEKLM